MDLSVYLRFLLVLLFVLALIFAIAWLVRRFGLAGQLTPNRSQNRRLSVIEVTALDARHKLVLLRRDSREYLVLLGPNQDLLLEGGIAGTTASANNPTQVATLPSATGNGS